jgi:hypothetical protein
MRAENCVPLAGRAIAYVGSDQLPPRGEVEKAKLFRVGGMPLHTETEFGEGATQ